MTAAKQRRIREAATRRRKAEIKRIDREIARHRETAAFIAGEMKALEDARAALLSPKPVRVKGTTPPKAVPDRKVAGPKAIKAIEDVLRSVGRTTQAEIGRATGRNSGTVTHALRVLEASKLARRTGRKEGGSPEWAWIGRQRTSLTDYDLQRLAEADAA